MLGAIGLEKANIKCITINALDLEHTLGQYNAKTVLLMSIFFFAQFVLFLWMNIWIVKKNGGVNL
jgi:hypothetical protein